MPVHRIVIAGGGVAALEAALAISSLGGSRVETTLLSPRTDFSYRAHQVLEPFGAEPALSLPLADILDGTGVELRHGAVAAVDPEAMRLTTLDGESLDYDGLLIAVGGTPFPAYAHGVVFDRPNDPVPFEELLDDVRSGLARDVAFIVPEAEGWTLPAYEVALLLRAWARRESVGVGIRLVTPERTPLEMFGVEASAAVGGALDRAEIEFVPRSVPVVISDTAVLAGAHWLTADRIVSFPRLAGPRISGLPCDWSGFVKVLGDGAVPNCPGVFAAGDGAAHRRKQGGLAAQQADAAARALLREAGINVPSPPEPPTLRGALATPEGPLFLQARIGYGTEAQQSVASFHPLWHPPAKVVTRWLGPHLDGLVARRTGAFSA